MPRSRLRRGLDAFVAGLCRLMLRTFFSEITIVGLERVPRGVPLVIVANHVNSLVDPMLLIGFLGVAPKPLAKSTLWRHPVVSPFLLLAGAIPVYRRGEADPSRNFEIFSRCARHVASGGAVALFPEGTSHNDTALRALKTGAARIALAAAAAGAAPGPLVLPVSLLYEAKETFRSRVVVRVGLPERLAGGDALPVEPAARVRAVTARIATALGPLVTSFAAWQGADPSTRASRNPGPPARILLPAAIVGLLLNWIPYRIPGLIADRFGGTHDARASYKLLAALLSFPLCWLAETVAAGRIAGVTAALVAVVLAPATALAAMRYFAAVPDARGPASPADTASRNHDACGSHCSPQRQS